MNAVKKGYRQHTPANAAIHTHTDTSTLTHTLPHQLTYTHRSVRIMAPKNLYEIKKTKNSLIKKSCTNEQLSLTQKNPRTAWIRFGKTHSFWWRNNAT